MAKYIISLPKTDNDGNSTRRASAVFIGRIIRAGGRVRGIGNGTGIWFGEGGTEYTDSVSVYVIDCSADVARAGAIEFGIAARQEAVLLVPVVKGADPYVETALGLDGARYLARKHGGATLLDSGTAFSVNYQAVERGADYNF